MLSVVSAQTSLGARDVAARVDQWIIPYVSAGDFSGVVMIAEGDRVLVEKAYGKADFEHVVANSVETRFWIASLSKTFTAAAIESLIAQGKITLQDHLNKYVSGIANGDQITVEQLLTHESGVGELDAADMYRECLPEEELIARLRKVSPMFAPGSDSHYSNEGYFLLAMILERVSRVSYERFLQKNIFAPLKLANTGSACKDLPTGLNATGYVPGDRPGSVVPLFFSESTRPGPGSLYSNAQDLLAWLRAVDSNPSFQASKFDYPYGWGKRNYSGRDLVEQSGIHEGFEAHMALYPKEHIYAVVLSNVQSGFFSRIPKDLEAVLFGGETSRPPDVKPIAVGEAALRAYQGMYKAEAIPIPQNMVVRDGKLFMQWGSYPFLRILTPTGKDEFFFRYEYAIVKFERDGKGRISKMTWQWPGGEPVAFARK
ncbi:MAG TPA: serine hydrolase [Terriglobales bacterium]|nr:serine hydrolase [Terriglobales bacterium]